MMSVQSVEQYVCVQAVVPLQFAVRTLARTVPAFPTAVSAVANPLTCRELRSNLSFSIVLSWKYVSAGRCAQPRKDTPPERDRVFPRLGA